MKRKLLSSLIAATLLFTTCAADVKATEYNEADANLQNVVTTEEITEDMIEDVTEVTSEEDIEEATVIATTEEMSDEILTEEQDGEDSLLKQAVPTVTYKTHVASKGWLAPASNGETAGTTGISKAIEALSMNVSGVDDLGIRYRVQGQSYGWQGWKENGAVAGTTGLSKRTEAICIELIGSAAINYDVYYRAYCQSYGWLSWTKNGGVAGTYGIAKRMEALEVVIVNKGASAPGDTSVPCYHEENIRYQAHCQSFGWKDTVANGATAGTIGMAKRLEAIKISIPDNPDLGVRYSTHVQSVGWQSYVTNGDVSGTIGESKRVEAIKIELTGSDSTNYNIWYRVHVRGYGWLGWAKNGEAAGSTGQARRVEAIQIKVLPVKASAPGSTTNALLSNSEASIKARQTLDRIGWDLKSAYDYSAGLTYYRNVAVPPEGKHLETYATYGFTNGKGNCYVMAATFCQMAREMGYEAYLVEGYVPSRRGGVTVHGWCEIKVDGRWYVCDPNFTNELGRNGYMVWYGTGGTWVYSNYKRVN